MTANHRRVVLVDAFAGPGRYLGGEPGSPLILIDCYLSHTYRSRMASEIVCLFIEERADRVAHLREEVGRLELPRNVQIHIEEGRYEDIFRKRLDELLAQRQKLAPTLAFVDPFGYSESPMDLTGQFLQFRRCEVLIYMPLPWVARFVGREGQERAITSLFGGDIWRPAIDLDGPERRQFLHDTFRDQLLAHGCSFVRSFEIDAGRGNGYNLFFGTSNELGLLKIKEAMWAADPIAGQRFSDSTRSDQLVLFDQDVDTTPLLTALRGRFQAGIFTIEQADRFTLLQTPFLPTHVRRRTLVPEEVAGRLQVLTARARARTYPHGTRMRFVQ